MALPLIAVGHLLFGISSAVYSIQLSTVRQACTPGALRGRVSASGIVVGTASLAAGALVGGAMAQGVGLVPALLVGAAGRLLALLWLARSPVRTIRV